MKTILRFLLIFCVAITSYGQTNTFPSSGDVGIGTISPAGKLHVTSDTSGDALFRLEADTDNNNEYDNPLIQFRQDGGMSGVNMGFSEGNFGGNIFGIGTRYSGQESWDTFTVNTQNGNIGIGNTSPSEKLHVSGNIKISSPSSSISVIGTGTGNYQGANLILTADGVTSGKEHVSTYFLNHRGTDGTATVEFQRRNTSNDYRGGILFYKDGYGWDFRTAATTTSTGTTTILALKSTGNVGIGTTIPDAKLTVKGDIHAEEVKVDLSVPGPDYVFKEDYDLKSLEEVQNYIKVNGHLPNIPSADEMKENGIQLGEMNMKLLEKIEELTLYILKQEQKIKNQNIIIMKSEKEIMHLKSFTQRLAQIEEYLNLKG